MDEGEIRLSQRQWQRLHVVRLMLEGRETVKKAAELLGLSERQVRRLRRKVDREGVKLSRVTVRRILRQVLTQKGIPLSIYMDRHGIFRRNDAHWTREERRGGSSDLPDKREQVGEGLQTLPTRGSI
ncbi:MAG: helix-turn-helix domain-containing protein [Nitrospirae bacterium]|nr:helix-turn-helix domain-containing protein [Nitrospirota bacterium]